MLEFLEYKMRTETQIVAHNLAHFESYSKDKGKQALTKPIGLAFLALCSIAPPPKKKKKHGRSPTAAAEYRYTGLQGLLHL